MTVHALHQHSSSRAGDYGNVLYLYHTSMARDRVYGFRVLVHRSNMTQAISTSISSRLRLPWKDTIDGWGAWPLVQYNTLAKKKIFPGYGWAIEGLCFQTNQLQSTTKFEEQLDFFLTLIDKRIGWSYAGVAPISRVMYCEPFASLAPLSSLKVRWQTRAHYHFTPKHTTM